LSETQVFGAPDSQRPFAGLHDSVVQRLLSWEHVTGMNSHWPDEGLQDPTAQRLSMLLHVFGALDSQRPVARLHDSVVQRLPSCEQVTGVNSQMPEVGLQEPTEQRLSMLLHVFGALDSQRPVAVLQVSVVQALPSDGQVTGWYSHAPDVGLHEPVWHWLSTGQLRGGPDSQRPVDGLQVSAVHLLPSPGQSIGGRETHCPFAGLQLSVVQRLSSCWQTTTGYSHCRVVGLQTLRVHRFPSPGHGSGLEGSQPTTVALPSTPCARAGWAAFIVRTQNTRIGSTARNLRADLNSLLQPDSPVHI